MLALRDRSRLAPDFLVGFRRFQRSRARRRGGESRLGRGGGRGPRDRLASQVRWSGVLREPCTTDPCQSSGPRSVGFRDGEDAAGLRADVEAVESSLAAVESDLQAEAYADANQGARSASSAARDIGSSLTAMAIEEEADSEDAATRAVRWGFDLPRRAYATGGALEPGPYRARLTDESAPVVDQEPATTTRWVEFLHEEEGTVAGRALATVVPDADIHDVAAGWAVRNQVRVDELREGDYVRVWLNRSGSSYLIHLPTAAP